MAKSRGLVLFLAMVSLLSGAIFAAITATAAIPVIDTQNILQQLKTYEQEAMTVINTAKQIELQYKELLNLPNQILNSYKSLLGNEIGELQSILKNTTGILNPDKKLDDLWISLFKPAGTPKNPADAGWMPSHSAGCTGSPSAARAAGVLAIM